MSADVNPLAPHTLPWFVTAPGATDVLYVITTIVVIFSVVMLGVFFFWLHSLPERMGHKKLQFEIVAVLGLISLFTHQHVFWIIGLLLAVIEIPDFISPLRRIAASAEKIAGQKSGELTVPPSDVSAQDKSTTAMRTEEHA